MMVVEADRERKFTRIHFDNDVNLEFVSENYEHCRIKDVSLGGLFAMGDFPQQVGRWCNIDIVRKGKLADLHLQALAKIVRKNSEGIGVEFSSMPFDTYIFLQASLLNKGFTPAMNGKIMEEECPFEVTDDLQTFIPDSHDSSQ